MEPRSATLVKGLAVVDASEYTERDLSNTIAPLGEWWRQVTDRQLDGVADLIELQVAAFDAFDAFGGASAGGSLDERSRAVQAVLVGSRSRGADSAERRRLRHQAGVLVNTSLSLLSEAEIGRAHV